MKILILGDATSPHIIKWVNALHLAGIEIFLFSLRKPDNSSLNKDIIVVFSSKLSKISLKSEGAFLKLLYLSAVPQIKSIINRIKPDIVHAHYASSYGLLGALVGFHPFIISVWGGDVISFPQISIIHKTIFKYILSKTDRILSTSKYMADLLLQYTPKTIELTPFGIDLTTFKPDAKLLLQNEDYDYIIGTIKGLEWYYGIEYLIEAFLIVTKRFPKKKLKLIIVGGGVLESKIKQMIKDLILEDKVLLTGKIKYSEVQNYHNLMDIFVAVSIYEESFGVSVLEASSCAKPVIISRVGGMIETVEENITGFIVPPRDAKATAEKIAELIENDELRIRMGNAGRNFVIDNYDLMKCSEKMIKIYEDVLSYNSNI